ncbi:MAG: P-loop NTPase [Candidatus Diapherotrites archaeon]
MGEIISIISGKGGVGKTTIALNVSSALKKLGYDSIVVEGNVTSPTASLYLGYMPARKTINNVLNGEFALDEVILEHDSGVKLVTCSLALPELAANYNKAFTMIRHGLKDKADLVFIDAGAGLGEEARNAIQVSDFVLVVTNPEMPAIIDALRAVRLARAMKRKVLGVVVNKVNSSMQRVSRKEIEDIVEAPVLAEIREDRAVHESFSYNFPVTHFRPNSRAGNEIAHLAALLVGAEHTSKENSFKDKLNFFLHKLGIRSLP